MCFSVLHHGLMCRHGHIQQCFRYMTCTVGKKKNTERGWGLIYSNVTVAKGLGTTPRRGYCTTGRSMIQVNVGRSPIPMAHAFAADCRVHWYPAWHFPFWRATPACRGFGFATCSHHCVLDIVRMVSWSTCAFWCSQVVECPHVRTWLCQNIFGTIVVLFWGRGTLAKCALGTGKQAPFM